MAIVSPLSFNTFALVKSNAAVSMQEVAGTEKVLYTGRADEIFIPTHVIIRTLSAGCPTAVMTFGVSGGNCDEFLGDQLLSVLDGVTKYAVLYPDQGTSQTPEGGILITAGIEFAMEVTTQDADGGTATIDVFGYRYEA